MSKLSNLNYLLPYFSIESCCREKKIYIFSCLKEELDAPSPLLWRRENRQLADMVELIRAGRRMYCVGFYFSVLASGAGSAVGAGAFWLVGLASSLAAGPWAVRAGPGPELAWLWGRLEG